MAVIDSLLALVSSQRAEGLAITSDEAPRLIFGAEERPLSMPPIANATVESFAVEVVGSGADASVATAQPFECRYRTRGGDEFNVRIEREGELLRLVLRPAVATAIRDETSPLSTSAELIDQTTATAPGQHESLDVRLLDLFSQLEREGGSDLVLSSGQPARLRSGGALRELAGPTLDDADILALIAPAMSDASHEQLRTQGSVDLALDLKLAGSTTRYRVNVFDQHRGLAAALRPIRNQLPSLSMLNLPDHLAELAEYRNGLVLVTGPAGSGKSTTLAALVQHLNLTAERHIITLEDPIEYQYEPKRCLIHQRELGRHVESFATGLRAALREDPDVIMVGEMRDRETIAAALTAAETGHLVLSTLHSASPWTSIDRMIDVFPSDQQSQARLQISDVLRVVVSQQLLPSTAPPTRYPAFEKLLVTDGVATLIRDKKLHQLKNSIQTGRGAGMVSLERSLFDLLQDGKIDIATAEATARDRQVFSDLSASWQTR